MTDLIDEQKEFIKENNTAFKLYSQIITALIGKYVDTKNLRTNLRERTRFQKNTTINKIINGDYKKIEKVSNKILLRICIGLLVTYEESCMIFFAFNRDLDNPQDKELKICKLTMEELKREYDIHDMNEVDRQDEAITNLHIANDIFTENGLTPVVEEKYFNEE